MAKLFGLVILCGFVAASLAEHVITADTETADEIPQELGETDKSARRLETEITQAFEALRLLLQQGTGTIPPLDPFHQNGIQLEGLDFESILTGDLEFLDFLIKGLSGFILKEGTFVPLTQKLKIRLNIPSVALTTNYKGDVTLFSLMNLFGAGKINLALNEFEIYLEAKLVLIGGMRITLDTDIILPSVNAKITGLYNDEYMSAIISNQLEKTANAFVQLYGQTINDVANVLLDALAEIISGILFPPNDSGSKQDQHQSVQEIVEKVAIQVIENRQKFIHIIQEKIQMNKNN